MASRQRHDLGNKKRRSGQEKNHPSRLLWLRIKRKLPGPEPWILRAENYKSWRDNGKPTKPPWPTAEQILSKRKKKEKSRILD